LQDAQNWLSKYVSDEDVIKEILWEYPMLLKGQ
jgi:hypothetical protein